MFDRLFQFIRQGVKDAILGGFKDASDELAAKLEAQEPITIEATTNGKAPTPSRRKTAPR